MKMACHRGDRGPGHRPPEVRHHTAHLWLLRRRPGRVQLLLQKRSLERLLPGCYDISSAGHIPAGVDFIPSALRELKGGVRAGGPAPGADSLRGAAV